MILDEIVAHKRTEVATQQTLVPLTQLQDQIERVEKPRDFRGALRNGNISLIAEIKRASPSKGDLLPDLDPVGLAALYEKSGVRAISVLTDQKYFKGSIGDLAAVRKNVKIPCLRKEFIIDPYQVYESRAAGSDAILLIVRILSDDELVRFKTLAESLDMAVLVETHTAGEIERAVTAGAHIIGINNRNLDTLEIDINTTFSLKKKVSGGNILVSESGIHTAAEVKALDDGGVDAILVGESLLTSRDIAAQIRQLLSETMAERC